MLTFFVKNLGATESEISCIPNNEEKYISFTKKILVDTFTGKNNMGEHEEVKVYWDLRFLDKFKFMCRPLESLTDNFSQDDRKALAYRFKGERLKLVSRRGYFPMSGLMDPTNLKRLNYRLRKNFGRS